MLIRKDLLETVLVLLVSLSPSTLGQSSIPNRRPATFVAPNSPNTINVNELALESFRNVTPGAQQFGLDLFAKFSDALQLSKSRKDFMISPFAIWSLLLLLVEGAAGNTLKQLRTALYIDEDQQKLRQAYSFVQRYLKTKTETIEVGSLQALFTNINVPPKRDFEDIITRYYGAALIPVDFHNPNETYHTINNEVRNATRGLIPYAVLPQDLVDARLVLMASLYFKGQWKHPFNKTLTRPDPFFDEDGNQIGLVDMMTQEADFNYMGMNELEGHVLELPYGKEDRLSMLVILPKRGVSLNKVTHNLRKIGTEAIFQKLAESAVRHEDEDVEVFLPKFTTSTDVEIPFLLHELGVADIFNPAVADLSQISPDLFVKTVFHTTKIIVDEEGTEASALVTAVLANKATPPKFYLNRPFLYLIVEKSTNVLLFAGQVMNPNNV